MLTLLINETKPLAGLFASSTGGIGSVPDISVADEGQAVSVQTFTRTAGVITDSFVAGDVLHIGIGDGVNAPVCYIELSSASPATGTMAINTVGMVALFAATVANRLSLQVGVVRTRGGYTNTIFSAPIVIHRSVIDPDTAVPTPSILGAGVADALKVAINTALGFVRLDASARLPAVDGSQLTNLPNTGGVTSITGTANEITVTGTTTPTLSLPSALTFTGKTVTGGTFNAAQLRADTTSDTAVTGVSSTDGTGVVGQSVSGVAISGSTSGGGTVFSGYSAIGRLLSLSGDAGENFVVANNGQLTLGGFGPSGIIVLNGSASGSSTITVSATGVLALPSGTTATNMALTTPNLGTPSAIVLTNASGTASININGTVGATTPTTGVFTGLTVNDNSTLGSNNSDTVNFNARVSSDINPATDNAYDLGVTGHEWRDLNIDGTANIDSLVADTADIDGGTIDATAIGATTPSTIAGTTATFSGNVTASAGIGTATPITGTAFGSFSGGLVVKGQATNTAGGALELYASDAVGAVDAYNRTTGLAIPLLLAGSQVSFSPTGGATMTLSTAGLLVTSTITASATTSLLLGTAGSAVGNVGFRNATSGTTTLAPATGALGTGTVTLPLSGTLATLEGSNTYTGTTNTFTLPTTTGTTTTSGITVAANSLTTGTGIYAASSTLTSGKLLDLQVSGTAAAASQTVLNIATAGANGTSGITSKGAVISNTHTGTTSTNVALELTASGGTTNYALLATGLVGIGTYAPSMALDVSTAATTGVIQATATGSNTFVGTFIGLAPNIGNGSTAYFTLGRNPATNNTASFGFYYAGNGSSSNRFDVIFYGGSPVFSVSAAGAVSATGTLAVTGATTLTGNLTSNGAYISTPQTLSGNGAVAAVNLTTEVTTIANTGTANTTTTLAAGTNGQKKVISFITDGGFDAVITVTNPAWGGAGTITMNDALDNIELRYLNSVWQVFINNGCTLA